MAQNRQKIKLGRIYKKLVKPEQYIIPVKYGNAWGDVDLVWVVDVETGNESYKPDYVFNNVYVLVRNNVEEQQNKVW